MSMVKPEWIVAVTSRSYRAITGSSNHHREQVVWRAISAERAISAASSIEAVDAAG